MKNKLIVLDAGHGLYTSGKQTMDGIIGVKKEWSLNKEVCNHIQTILSDYHVDVKRSDDVTGRTDIPLIERTKRANKWGADLFISIHHNAGGGTGTEVYHHTRGTAEDKKVAQIIAPKLAKSLGCRDRGVKHAAFTVLSCNATAVLVEGLFMDTKADYEKMVQVEYQRAYAEAVAQSIIEHMDLKKKVVEKPATQEVYRVRDGWENAATQKGAYKELDNAIAEAKKHKNYEVYDSTGATVWPTKYFMIKIKANALNVRQSASFDANIVTAVKQGEVYTITEERNGMGKLLSGIGWVSLGTAYVERLK